MKIAERIFWGVYLVIITCFLAAPPQMQTYLLILCCLYAVIFYFVCGYFLLHDTDPMVVIGWGSKGVSVKRILFTLAMVAGIFMASWMPLLAAMKQRYQWWMPLLYTPLALLSVIGALNWYKVFYRRVIGRALYWGVVTAGGFVLIKTYNGW